MVTTLRGDMNKIKTTSPAMAPPYTAIFVLFDGVFAGFCRAAAGSYRNWQIYRPIEPIFEVRYS